MCLNIASTEIRKRISISIRFLIQDQATLAAVALAAKLASQKQSQFERHIEPRKTRLSMQSDKRQIMYTELAFRDDVENLGQPLLCRIIPVESAKRPET